MMAQIFPTYRRSKLQNCLV